MTDYDAMTDDELSAAVAVRVMGWRRHAMGGWIEAGTVDDDVTYFSAPNYAVSWANAGRVLEKMRADGWDCLIEIEGTMEGGPQSVSVDFSRPDRSGNATAATAARAISIAALRAVEARA